MNKHDEKAEAARLRGEMTKVPRELWISLSLVVIGVIIGSVSGFMFGRQNVQLEMAEEGLYFSGLTASEPKRIPHTPEPSDAQMTATIHLLVTQEGRIASLEAIPDHTATLESHAELLRLMGSAMINQGWIVQDGDQLRLVAVQAPTEEEPE